MKKPKIEPKSTSRENHTRRQGATEGYSLVVDGHFKSHHDTVEAAEEAGMALKNQYQMLQVQVYDASTTDPIDDRMAPRRSDAGLGSAPAALLARQPVCQGRALFS